MSGKHLINRTEDAVDESLLGLKCAYPSLDLHAKERVVFKAQWKRSSDVGVISGGGSGHEPFAAGFVGDGMLTAAVCGSIYASPPPQNVFHAIERISAYSKAGCLVIIPNYTGDCLNFGLAVERAKCLGLKVEQVTVGEDCSIPDDELGRAGKRALPGIVLVMKVAGSLANMGCSLEEVTKNAKLVAANIASCSIGLTPCSIPGDQVMFEIEDDKVEFGQGLHGEAGYERIKLLSSAETAKLMIDRIKTALPFHQSDYAGIVVLVNNFGALSLLELQIFVNDVYSQITKMGVAVKRLYSGHIMTSLDSSGVNLSILRLPKHQEALLLDALDRPTRAARWPGSEYSKPLERETPVDEQLPILDELPLLGPSLPGEKQSRLLRLCLEKACEAIVLEAGKIDELDRGCGDGDCGATHKRFANGILSSLNDGCPLTHPAATLAKLTQIAENVMGGTSGAIYSLMLMAASAELAKVKVVEDWFQLWLRAWRAGINCVTKYSKAELGDKTLIDVLKPCLDNLEQSKCSYKEAIALLPELAEKCAEKTKKMIPRAGRASYVKQSEHLNKIDPGAHAVVTWIKAICYALKKSE